jgi:hypothetical protein
VKGNSEETRMKMEIGEEVKAWTTESRDTWAEEKPGRG